MHNYATPPYPGGLHIPANTAMEVDNDFQASIQRVLKVAQGVEPKQPNWSLYKALDVA